ncbi:NAD(+)/NADH kinase [Pelotomaculum terephthalicicum JT]|uniref:NAD(+)/NADH kinase n=1 Tax=Pelotomaculum TaxID=191373 RepID=UPI0009C4DBC3|nr:MULTISPECIES: NAD(+)/NADH kinase [Pelotomaculum]MCG9968531.1 NAD(+)/NADH kinase [Pelotomaculum terephthalicicum JT]OPX85028.1 MAG: putative inorganic polyphosphate/ATP-NAD kinase [Pelotomaculum sp. PtaB.Bin117]OPY62772.1 MAG: putative inorganic polyphosphate/ATP-NAD kinase [Pelotomaculum sp. PtaU1.Bin065]
MNTIGLVINLHKKGVVTLVEEVINWLEDKGRKVLIEQETAGSIGLVRLGTTEKNLIEQAECVIVLGGDGTLLRTTRKVAAAGKPVIGVNLGHLGFLTEIDIPEVIPALGKMLAGQYYIEERMMLEALVYRDNEAVEHALGLNDAVITNGAFARLIHLETYVNNEYVNTYPSNGLIIASPTGSTAYSLSAGGPLVTPDLNLMLITPICPHTLWARPLVVAPESTVKVVILSGREEIMLTMDGQHGFRLLQSDQVLIRQASQRARFLRLKGRGFFELLGKKLKEEGDRSCD